MIASPKRAPLLVLFAVIIAAALPAVVLAQCPAPPTTSPLAEGEVGLFFDTLGRTTCTDILVAVPTPLYVVARVPEGGVAEFDVTELLVDQIPAGLVFLDRATLPPGSPYDLLIVVDGCSRARRPDPMACPVARGDLLVLSVTNVMAMTSIVGTACFQASCPTIAGPRAGAPSFLRCDTGAAGEFVGGDSMCIGFSQAPVAVEPSTWGTIKARYGE